MAKPFSTTDLYIKFQQAAIRFA